MVRYGKSIYCDDLFCSEKDFLDGISDDDVLNSNVGDEDDGMHKYFNHLRLFML